MILYVNSDGGSRGNPGNSACAFVVKDEKGDVIFKWSKYLGQRTNNQAEYMGVVMALKWLEQNHKKYVVEKVIYRLDSELIAKQLSGQYKVKSKLLIPYVTKAKEIIEKLTFTLSFEHVARKFNSHADSLVNEELDKIVAPSK